MRSATIAYALLSVALLVTACTGEPGTEAITSDENPANQDTAMTGDAIQATNEQGFTSVAVGVASLDDALALWVNAFGFDVVRLQEGPDAELSRLWKLGADAIARQALLQTDESGVGRLHLVEYQTPGPSIREGAEVFDLLPKNLDVYVDDLPRRAAELRASGYEFRTETHSEVTAPDGTVFRELHMPVHDDINVVLLEVVGQSYPFTDRGFAGIGPLIFISPDASADKDFLRDVLGLRQKSDNLLQGPEVERMVGLPPGAGLDVSIWGGSDDELGGLEIVDYQGVEGSDRYPLARPGARGVLHVTFDVKDASSIVERARQAGAPVEETSSARTLTGSGRVFTVTTPAGLRIELREPD